MTDLNKLQMFVDAEGDCFVDPNIIRDAIAEITQYRRIADNFAKAEVKAAPVIIGSADGDVRESATSHASVYRPHFTPDTVTVNVPKDVPHG